MSTGVEISLSGTASVHCVHDRQKRQVTTERQLFDLGLEVGLLYDPRQHKIHRCGCCDNLFVDPADTPRYCSVCLAPNRHQLGGPLNDPVGVTDG